MWTQTNRQMHLKKGQNKHAVLCLGNMTAVTVPARWLFGCFNGADSDWSFHQPFPLRLVKLLCGVDCDWTNPFSLRPPLSARRQSRWNNNNSPWFSTELFKKLRAVFNENTFLTEFSYNTRDILYIFLNYVNLESSPTAKDSLLRLATKSKIANWQVKSVIRQTACK